MTNNILGNTDVIKRARALFETEPCNAVFYSHVKGLGKHTVAKEILSGYPEVLFVDGDGFNVEECSKLLEKLSIVPAGAKKRIILVDNASSISAVVQNKLLKVVEDEQEYNVFLFIAHGPLLSTLMSRCMCFTFYPLSNNDVERFLSEQGLLESEKDFYTLLMDGSVGVYHYVKNNEALYSLLHSVYELYLSDKVSSSALIRAFSLENEKSTAYEEWEPELAVILRFLTSIFLDVYRARFGLKTTKLLAYRDVEPEKVEKIHDTLFLSLDLYGRGLFTKQELFRLLEVMGGK